jgi:DNA-binding transcriptional ArsR family regulator
MKRDAAARMLEALGHPNRLAIVEALVGWPEGWSAAELAEELGIPGSTLSFHLGCLVKTGILNQQRLHQKRIYRLIPGRLTEAAAFLTEIEKLGSARR